MMPAAPASFMYVHSDVPEGATLSAWRQARTAPSARRLPRLPRLGAPLRLRPVG
jgi:hypothetical protein